MQDRASPEVKPGGNCEVRASSKIVLKPSYPCSGMTSREQQGVEMKLKRMDRQETIWRARKRLPAPACRKQGEQLADTLPPGSALAGATLLPPDMKLLPLDRHEVCVAVALRRLS